MTTPTPHLPLEEEDDNFAERPGDETSNACNIYSLVMSGGVVGGTCVFGIVANILTLLVLPRFARMAKGSSPTTVLLGALAVSDAVLLLLLLILQAIPPICSQTTGQCAAYWSVFMYLVVWAWPCASVAHMLSSWIIVLTTVHRYIVVCYPHRAKQLCTMKNTRRELAAVILFVFLYEIPLFADDQLVSVTGSDNTTTLQQVYTALGENNVYQVTYKTSLYYIFVFFIPVTLISVLTGLLLRELRRSTSLRTTMATNSEANSSAEDELTRALIAVVGVYLCCQPWEPARRIVEAVSGGRPGCPSLYFYFQVMPAVFATINSAMNFVLFCMFGTKFRRAFFDMFGCFQEKDKSGTSSARGSNTAAPPPNSGGHEDTGKI